MRLYREGLSSKALVFLHIVVLLLSPSFQGRSQGVDNSPSVVALVGEDVLLPCRLEAAADAVSLIVEWARPELKPRFVHLWHEGQSLSANQNPSYKDRTMLSMDKLKQGDLSLTLFKVKLSDSGTYRCFVPKMNRESTVKLTVGSVSSPFIQDIDLSSDKDVLQCRSEGWYPEPEVFWMDSEGRVLSAEPAKTIPGSHGLFTVSSRVTVEKSNDNNFTCRVHQKTINQTRETHIHVSAQIINSSFAVRIAVVLAAFCICIIAVCFVLWKMKQMKTVSVFTEHQLLRETQNYEPDQVVDPSEDQRKTTADLLEAQRKTTLDLLEGQRKTMSALEEQKKTLESLVQELKDQEKLMEKNAAETETKLEAAKKEADKDKTKENFELIDIVLWARKQLKERKQENGKLMTDVQMLLLKTDKLHQNLKTSMTPEERSCEFSQESQSAAGV